MPFPLPTESKTTNSQPRKETCLGSAQRAVKANAGAPLPAHPSQEGVDVGVWVFRKDAHHVAQLEPAKPTAATHAECSGQGQGGERRGCDGRRVKGIRRRWCIDEAEFDVAHVLEVVLRGESDVTAQLDRVALLRVGAERPAEPEARETAHGSRKGGRSGHVHCTSKPNPPPNLPVALEGSGAVTPNYQTCTHGHVKPPH